MSLSDFFSFRRMITPIIIEILFWIFAAISVIGGLVSLTQGGSSVLFGLLLIFIGPLIARVYCEIVIVVFRINETLTDIRANTRPAPPAEPAPPSSPQPEPDPAG